ncbi:DUF805 domain-containing protein [Pseudomonas syringae]|nr:DUF805 domain-containing protein [Pseudomonas syringae]
MTTPLFKIVFEGQLRNGVELQTAKLNLASLFNSEVTAVDNLFSGKPVALKRGLTQADAQIYLKALNDAGVEARIEADPAISLNLQEVEETSEPLYESQPPPTSPYAPPRASVIDTLPEHSTLKVFSFQGRIGRVRYLAWTLVWMALLFMVLGLCVYVMALSLVGGGLLIAVAVAAFALVSFQIGAQRLHDAGWSGWLLLLSLVPYIGAIFPFLMVLMPGNKTANRYGPPAPPNSRSVKVLAWLWILFLCLFIAGGMTGGLNTLHEEIEASTAQYEQSLPDDSTVDSQLEDEDDQ